MPPSLNFELDRRRVLDLSSGAHDRDDVALSAWCWNIAATSTPNWAPGASPKMATSNVPQGYYFNPFAFALPIIQANQPIASANDPTTLAPQGGTDIGNVGRNVLRGPSQSNIDIAFTKRFSLNEARGFEVRADFFNVLNHANRSTPISDINAAEMFDPGGQILSPGDFGRSLSFDSSPRIIQLSVKFIF
jgi:hypothetical protein